MGSNWIRVIADIGLFVGAGLCEIAGGWLVWKFRKDGWHWVFFIVGSLILVLYGIIPTFQSQPFGRTYAAYGGFFIGLSLLWGWVFDSQQPDKWDFICAAIAVGACIVMISVPRNPEAGMSQPAVLSLEDHDVTRGYPELRDNGLVTGLHQFCSYGSIGSEISVEEWNLWTGTPQLIPTSLEVPCIADTDITNPLETKMHEM